MKKKILSVLLIGILVVGLTGCGKESQKEYSDAIKKERSSTILLLGDHNVGGAGFLEGKLLKPKRYSGFEVGHIIIQDGGEKCNCGAKGCFEAYASIKRLKEKIKKLEVLLK